ncbi:hypothetical protein BC835DRAFT_497417 [Cytidiella melzeri]|nr:hypothetical protein BC835DRAFT_497417 [Cytidiella melzeri]
MPHKRAKRSARDSKRSQEGHDNAPAKSALTHEAIPKGAARILNAWKVQDEYNKKRKFGMDEAEDGASQKKRRKVVGEVGERKSGGAGVRQKGGKADIRIQPGESLAHFNRRVEESLRPLVRDAMQTSAAVARKVRKEEEEEKAAKKASSSNKKQTDKDKPAPDKHTQPSTSKPQPTTSSKPQPAAFKVPPAQAFTSRPDRPKEFTSLSSSAPRRLNDIVQAPPELKKLPRGAKARQIAASGKTDGTKSLKDGVLSMAQKAMMEEERDRVIKAYRVMKKRNVED